MSLVEVACSGVAVAVALIGASAAVISSVQLNDSTNRTRESARSVGSLIEDIRNTPFDSIDDFNNSHHDVARGDASVSITDVTSRTTSRWKVYRVQVDVSYDETVADAQLAFVTYVTDRDQSSSLSGVPTTNADSPSNGEPIDVPDDGQDPPPSDPPSDDPPPDDGGNGNGNGNGNSNGNGNGNGNGR